MTGATEGPGQLSVIYQRAPESTCEVENGQGTGQMPHHMLTGLSSPAKLAPTTKEDASKASFKDSRFLASMRNSLPIYPVFSGHPITTYHISLAYCTLCKYTTQ